MVGLLTGLRHLRCGSELALTSDSRWIKASRRSAVSLALGTPSPVDHFGFINLVAEVVGRRETRSESDCAVHILHASTDATDQVMVIVIDSTFVERGRSDRLNSPDKALVNQHAESVVHGLARDGADINPGGFGHTVGRDVRLSGHGPQHRQALGRRLDAVLAKEVNWARSHSARVPQILD